MVSLTRLTGARFALNPDLIERVDRTPDTVITLVDGTKYLVQESLDEVVEAVLGYRAQVLAGAQSFERTGAEAVRRRARLTAVPDPDQPTPQPAGQPADQPAGQPADQPAGQGSNAKDTPGTPGAPGTADERRPAHGLFPMTPRGQ